MAKKVKKKELGQGIRALLSNMESEESPEKQKEVVRELSHTVATISLDQIEVNPFQPRNEFDPKALEELSESLKVHGVIQPITVRRLNDEAYQLISGERRLRASKMAGLTEVPAYIRLANDQEMLEMALVENIQRQNLNPIEVAQTYQRLIDECDLTHENLADRIGKKRITVTHFLGLLKLPPQIQTALKEKRISAGHGKALSGIDDLALQLSLFNEVISQGLSVRATEALRKKYTEPAPAKPAPKTSLPDAYKDVQDQLCDHFGSKVSVKADGKGKGQIVLKFDSDDELNRLLDIIEGN
ncbi:MAG: ParB/RepB/Spo0J family partition protein [Bacteroidetes bacterium]|nr:ParB/RepB/Spo0J family partition protein [Bacteroidota bacterium]